MPGPEDFRGRIQTEERVQTVCLFVLAAFAVGTSLYFLGDVLKPFLLAAFIAISLNPIIDFLAGRLRISRIAAMIVTFLLGTGLVVAFGAMVWVSVREFQSQGDQYLDQLKNLEGVVNQTLIDWGIMDAPSPASSASDPSAAVAESGKNGSLFGKDGLLGGAMRSALGGIGSLVGDAAGTLTMVLIFLMFLMLGKAVSEEESTGARAEILASIKSYIITKTLLSAATGALTALILWFLGVPFWYGFGVFAFILNFIPTIGSIVATLLPMPVVLWSWYIGDMDWWTASLAFVLPSIVQLVIGNVIEPKMLGKSLDLHPIIVLLALIFFSVLWGPIGALLATPLTAALKILFEKSPFTKPLADLLAGRRKDFYGAEADENQREAPENQPNTPVTAPKVGPPDGPSAS